MRSRRACVLHSRRGTHGNATLRIFGGLRETLHLDEAHERVTTIFAFPTVVAAFYGGERENARPYNYRYRSYRDVSRTESESAVIHCSFASARSEWYIIAPARAKRFTLGDGGGGGGAASPRRSSWKSSGNRSNERHVIQRWEESGHKSCLGISFSTDKETLWNICL